MSFSNNKLSTAHKNDSLFYTFVSPVVALPSGYLKLNDLDVVLSSPYCSI